MPNDEEYAKRELAQIKAGLLSSLVSSITRSKQNISPEEARKLAETLLTQFPDEVEPEPQKKVVWPLNPKTLTSVTAYDLLKILKELEVLPTISFTTSAKDVIIGRKSPDVPDQRKLKERFPEGVNDLNEELFFLGDKKFYAKFFDNAMIDEHLFITFSVLNYDKLVIDEFKFTKAELSDATAPAVAEFEFYIRQDKKDGEPLSFKDFYLVKETYGVIDADIALHSLHPVQGFTTKVHAPDYVNALAIFNRATEFFESRHLLGFKKNDVIFNDGFVHLIGKNAKVGNPGDHTDTVIRSAVGFCTYINKDIINCERLSPDYEELLCGHYENKVPIEPSAKFNQKLLEHVYTETRSGIQMNVFLTGAKDVDTLKKRLEKYLQSIIDVNKEFAANEELKNTIEEIGSKEKELTKLRNELTEFKNQVAKKHLKAFEIKANSEGFEV
jgi:hypothetical protein